MARTQSDASDVIAVISGSGSGTEGSYVEAIASTSFATQWMLVSIFSDSAQTDHQAEFDIATGSGGSEVDIIVDQFQAQRISAGGIGSAVFYSFPFEVASGTRIAVRIKDNNGSTLTHQVWVVVIDTPLSGDIPTVMESSGSVAVVSGGADVYGSYVELVAALNQDVTWAIVTVHIDGTTKILSHYALATGAGGAEVNRVEGVGVAAWTTGTGHRESRAHGFPVSFLSGDRVAIQTKDDVGSKTTRVGAIFFG